MLFEPTTLSAVAKVIAETLQADFHIDPRPVFHEAGLDTELLAVAGARYPVRNMQALWAAALVATGDACFGLHVGRRIRPTSFHALGFSWLASENLLGSLERLCRYHRIITTAPVQLHIETAADRYGLVIDPAQIEYFEPTEPGVTTAIDALCVGIVQLCRAATVPDFAPVLVTFVRPAPASVDEYVKVFGAPVEFSASERALYFDRASLEAPLPGDNMDLVRANDRVAEQYLDSIEPARVGAEVRRLLVELMPSGNLNQERIATRLNRSLSTLQRQLQSEGTNYQQIRDDTRRALAEEYVREGRLSLSQIAYMLGFSDQSNFSRAFKRWTGCAPREFRR